MDLSEVCIGPNKLCHKGFSSSRCFTSKRCANFVTNGSETQQVPLQRTTVEVNHKKTRCPGKSYHYNLLGSHLGDKLRLLVLQLYSLEEQAGPVKYLHISRKNHTAPGSFDRFLLYKNGCYRLRTIPKAAEGAVKRPYFDIVQHYIAPRLNTSSIYKAPFKSRDDEVVIHLRSSDMQAYSNVSANYVEEATIPCAFYSHAVDHFPASPVRVVTEADNRRHPCIQTLRAKRPNLVVQSSSRERDASTIIFAKYFVASPSWFSYTMLLLNTRLKKTVFFQSHTDGGLVGRWVYPCRPGVEVVKATTLGHKPPVFRKNVSSMTDARARKVIHHRRRMEWMMDTTVVPKFRSLCSPTTGAKK